MQKTFTYREVYNLVAYVLKALEMVRNSKQVADKKDSNGLEHDEKGRFTSKEGAGATLSENDKEIEEKIKSLEKLDLTKPCTLPQLNKDILEKYNLANKPILLKQAIIEKNKARHPDITEEDARLILGTSLYKPDVVFKANPDKPAYHNFIARLNDDYNSIVCIELSEKKENYEIVNYHYLNNEARERKEKINIKI